MGGEKGNQEANTVSAVKSPSGTGLGSQPNKEQWALVQSRPGGSLAPLCPASATPPRPGFVLSLTLGKHKTASLYQVPKLRVCGGEGRRDNDGERPIIQPTKT